MTQEKLWTKDFVTVSVINFMVFLIHFLLMVTIASYAVDEFHASTTMAGLVAGIFIIGALVGRLGIGRIIENTGSKKILVAGTILYIITAALYLAAADLSSLIFVRFINGIAFGAASTATGTIVAQIIPPARRGEGIGYYSMGAIIAIALGPFIGVLLIQAAHFKMIFIVCTLLAAVSFAISFILDEPVYSKAGKEKREKYFRLSGFLEFKVIPISIIILVIGFSYSGVITFISLFAKEFHLEKAAGFYFLVYSLTVLISRPFSGRIYDLKGADFLAYPCLLLYAAGMLLFSQANEGFTLLAAAVVIGLGYGNFISCSQATAIKAVPVHRMGLATSTFFIFVDLGFGVGPYLLGALVSLTGYRGLYLIMSGVILANILLYYFLVGRKKSG